MSSASSSLLPPPLPSAVAARAPVRRTGSQGARSCRRPCRSQLFALGLLGASLLAASVVPLSTSYGGRGRRRPAAFCQRQPSPGPIVLRLFTLQIVVGAGVALAPGNLVSLVVNTQVLNGVITPLLLTYVLVLANRRSLLGNAVNGKTFNIVATVSVAVTGLLSFVVLVRTLAGL